MVLLSDTCDIGFYSNMISVLGCVIAFLGILVTLLIGWQIFTSITLNKRLNKHEEKINLFVRNSMECIDNKITARSFHSMGMVEFELNKHNEALSSFYISTSLSIKAKDEKIIQDNIYFLNLYKSNNYIDSMSSDDVTNWIDVLSKVDNINSIELIKYFSSIEIKGDSIPDEHK